MAKKKPSQRKRRTREHIIADLSVNHLERHVLLCGFTLQRSASDYGVDSMMNTFDANGEIENGEVFFQLKATDHVKLSADGQTIQFRIERKDLRAWLDEPMPVILVVYDAPADFAYWLYVQAHFEGLPKFNKAGASQTVTVRVPTSQRVDPSAVQAFAQHKARVLEQQKGLVHHA